MDIETTYNDDAATLVLGGHLNTNTASELEEQMNVVFQTTHNVSLDCTALEYLSSAGLRVLVGAQKEVTAAGGSMRILNVCDDVREVFEITGLIDVFDVA